MSNLTLLRSVRDGGGPRRLAFAVVLGNASIESSQTSASRGTVVPSETIVINYARIRWLHWLEPGGAVPSSDLCYNAATNQFCWAGGRVAAAAAGSDARMVAFTVGLCSRR